MILNLFSIFDPSSSLGLSLNWAAFGLGLLFFPSLKFFLSFRWGQSMGKTMSSLVKEMSLLLGESKNSFAIIFISLFILIFFNNLLGLLPYLFTPTSHLSVTLSMAFPLWLGYYSYGWVKNFKGMMAHLVPQGTPPVLMPFMVVIESVSSWIRPGTLSVRLAANMVAGHMLLALMSGSLTLFSGWVGGVVVGLQVLLVVLEVAVAAIQAYVLVILSVLYTSEV